MASQRDITLQFQSATPLSDLDPSLISVQGGSLTSITPVAGGNGQLFDVALAAASDAGSLVVSAKGGLTLSGGRTSTQSNSVTIDIDDAEPQVGAGPADSTEGWLS